MTSPRSLSRRLLTALCVLAAGGACSDGPGGSAEAGEAGPAPGALLLGEAEGLRAQAEAEAQAEAAASRSPEGSIPTLSGEAGIPLGALGHTLGSPTAPIQVVEFSDFGCGYCRQFHLESWPELEKAYVETGKVEWKYVPMVLGIFGPNAEEAALAGDCAIQQDRFPPVRDRLFEEQGRWKGADEPGDVFREIVREEGLDVEQWEMCMDGERSSVRIASGNRHARESGIRGTPTFFILGEGMIPGAVPVELFRTVLDEIYDERSR